MTHGNRRSTRAAAGGFTLIEMMIVVAVMSVLLLISISLLSTSSQTLQAETTVITLETEGRRALERMAEEIRRAQLTILSGQVPLAPDSVPTLTVQEVTGFSAMAPTYGPAITYAERANPTTGFSEVTRTEGGRTSVLASYVQAGGLVFQRDPNFANKLIIRISLQGPGPNGQTISRVVETGIYPRN